MHAPTRLQVCALLGAVDSVELGTVRDELAISDSVLRLSRAGRAALDGHVLELRRLLAATGRMSG